MKENTKNAHRTVMDIALKHFEQKANGVKPWKKLQKGIKEGLNIFSEGSDKLSKGSDEMKKGSDKLSKGSDEMKKGSDKI